MITRGEWLVRVGQQLNVLIEIDYCVEMPDGHTIRSTARIPYFGAANGVLVVKTYDDVKPYLDELRSMKYAFSVFDPDAGEVFDEESIIDMFRDWGWRGDPKGRPSWAR